MKGNDTHTMQSLHEVQRESSHDAPEETLREEFANTDPAAHRLFIREQKRIEQKLLSTTKVSLQSTGLVFTHCMHCRRNANRN